MTPLDTTTQREIARRPAVGEKLRLSVTDMALDGDAVASLGGYVVLLRGALPGEEVDAEIESAGRKFARARLLSVLKPSPHRVAPPCRYFGPCGGCTWQHIDYPEQLRLKQKLLAGVLERALPVPAPVAPAVGPESPWGFRGKVHFVVGSGPDGQAVLGHFGAHSRELVAVEECPVHDPRGNRVAFRIRDLLRRHKIPPVKNDRPGTGTARHLVVRASGRSGEAQAILVATRRKFPGLEELAREAISGPDAASGFHLNTNKLDGNRVLGSFTRKLAGRERLLEEAAGVRFLVSPASFFQTSARAAAQLAELVIQAVGPGDGAVLDLYAGVGLFALPLARRGRRVVAVEENPYAIRDGIETARLNGIHGARLVHGRAEVEVRKMSRRESFQAVVLDPPREGCAPRVLLGVARDLRPARIVYVSCDPRALARDLGILVRSGYRIDEVRPVDMFPHTSHIEAVAKLTLIRSSRPPFRSSPPEVRSNRKKKHWRRS